MAEPSRADELFRLLVEAVVDYAIFALDPEGQVLSWNRGARRIKGYEAEEIVGRHFSVFYPEEAREAGTPERVLETARREGRFEGEGWRLRKDGTRFWASVVVTALHNEDGDVVGFGKVVRDLTERKHAQEREVEAAARIASQEAALEAAEERRRELAELNERLEAQASELEERRAEADEANRAKSDFLAVMSHELRTPLNAIGGYVDLLLEGVRGPLADRQRTDLERVRRSQKHLLALVNDLLNFARLESGSLNYEMGDVDVAGVVRDVLDMVKPQLDEKGLRLVGMDGCDSLAARGDREKLTQVLLNLLSNAVKFTPEGGEISVEGLRLEDGVEIRVRDTGPGLEPAESERVFEPFIQIHPELTGNQGGVGLGLSISRELARGMGGELELRSSSEGGSCFVVTLPPAEGDGASAG